MFVQSFWAVMVPSIASVRNNAKEIKSAFHWSRAAIPCLPSPSAMPAVTINSSLMLAKYIEKNHQPQFESIHHVE